MSDVPAAVGFDRLAMARRRPSDARPPAAATPAIAPASPRNWRVRELLGWAISSLRMIAGVSYWLGVRPLETPLPAAVRSDLPHRYDSVAAARGDAGPVPQALPPQSQSNPCLSPRRSPPRRPWRRSCEPRSTAGSGSPGKLPAYRAAPPSAAKPAPLALWPVRVEAGASGWMVRIGTFARG